MSYVTPAARWRAVVSRDASAINFVYGVRTTKIYCRPRCPARLARRANVEFYDTPEQAEKAGYRACMRCKPQDQASTDPRDKLAQRACEMIRMALIAKGAKQKPTLQQLAAEAGLTPSHFHRVFKKVIGITPGKFARDLMESHNQKLRKLGSPASPGLLDSEESPAALANTSVPGEEKISTLDSEGMGIGWNEFDLFLSTKCGSDEDAGTCSRVFDTPEEDQINPGHRLNDLSVKSNQTDISTYDMDYPYSQSETDSSRCLEAASMIVNPPLLFGDVDWVNDSGILQGYG